MNLSQLRKLSPDAARRRLDEVDLDEKSRLAEGIALIALIDQRRDYLAAGYSSMLLAALVPPLWRRIMDPRVHAWRERHAATVAADAGAPAPASSEAPVASAERR